MATCHLLIEHTTQGHIARIALATCHLPPSHNARITTTPRLLPPLANLHSSHRSHRCENFPPSIPGHIACMAHIALATCPLIP